MIEADHIERMVSPRKTKQDNDLLDKAIRPQRLADYIGQSEVCEQLEVAIKAARKRGGALDHVLIYGPPGLGKTTLSNIIANEMGANFFSTSGPVLEKKADLAAILSKLSDNDVLFIDEIHRLSPVIEEFLYPAMEDFKIDFMLGEGPSASSIKIDLPPFTLIGATTKVGALTSPLYDRFGITERLRFYNVKELTTIVKRSASVLHLDIEESGALEIACRSRGTPRIANRLLRRIRDYAEICGNGVISKDIAALALNKLDIDDSGFDFQDRRYLLSIIEDFNGGPVGVDNLAALLGEDRDTIEDVLEPYMIQQGFVQRTPRGRIATSKAYRYFSIEEPSYESNK